MQQALAALSPYPALAGKKLGPHHFAYLRGISEGLDAKNLASRYLGAEELAARRAAHDQVISLARGVARRNGHRTWRLVGITIKANSTDTARPSLTEFCESRGLEGWSEQEQIEFYEAAFEQDFRAKKREALRQKQVDLLKSLEAATSETPSIDHLVSEWFDPLTSSKLIAAGVINLGALAARIDQGGAWYRSMPGIGVSKAQKIAQHLTALLPSRTISPRPFQALQLVSAKTKFSSAPSSAHSTAIQPASLLSATTDQDAISAWLQARCSSAATAKSYEREARRLMLWLKIERQIHRLADMKIEECLAYQFFLQQVPQQWISRNHAAPGEPAWAPFRGQISPASQTQAIKILSGLFEFLTTAKYLASNPWILVNRDSAPADQATRAIDTKAIGDAAMASIMAYLHTQPPSPAVSRMIFIVTFMRTVGLRSAELLSASLGDFSFESEGLVLKIKGKGSRLRTVFVPQPAVEALQNYLHQRGQNNIQTAPPGAPLLSSTSDPNRSIGYQALYNTVKIWLQKAIAASPLTARERADLAGATTHWLRHTFGTTAVAGGVPFDVVQQQLGHADISTTMNIYSRAPLKRRADELSKAFR